VSLVTEVLTFFLEKEEIHTGEKCKNLRDRSRIMFDKIAFLCLNYSPLNFIRMFKSRKIMW
jgi:hypothetical protein